MLTAGQICEMAHTMSIFFSNYLDDLNELHREIISIIEQLPKEALDWSLCNNANSICVLVVHIAGAERYWIGDVIAGDPSGRIRESEFRVNGLSAEELRKRLTDASSYCRGVITGLSTYDLEKEITSPRDGRIVTVGWSLLHIIEHTAMHLGHIQITSQLWGKEKTD